MKKILVPALLFMFLAGAASAQTSGTSQGAKTNSGGGTSSSSKTAKKSGKSKTSTTKLNQRKPYNWSNGQKATPTGEEATSVNGNSFISGKKDTSAVKHKR